MDDPAITKAKSLWKDKQPREAMMTLIRRVRELGAVNAALNDQIAGLEARPPERSAATAFSHRHQERGGAAAPSANLQGIIDIFLDHRWRLDERMPDYVRLSKKRGPGWVVGVLLTMFLGLLGGLVILADRHLSDPVTVTLQEQEGRVRMISRRRDQFISHFDQAEGLASSVRGMPQEAVMVLAAWGTIVGPLLVILLPELVTRLVY